MKAIWGHLGPRGRCFSGRLIVFVARMVRLKPLNVIVDSLG